MFYLYFFIIAVLMIGYLLMSNRMGDEIVDGNVVVYPIKPVDESVQDVKVFVEEVVVKQEKGVVGAQWFVPKVIEEPKVKQKPDLREQYRIWVENARSVNESYQREYALRMRGSA